MTEEEVADVGVMVVVAVVVLEVVGAVARAAGVDIEERRIILTLE